MIEQNHEYYVSLEVAKLLEEAGFEWDCKKIYFKTGWKGNDDVWEIEYNKKKTNLVLELDYCILAPTLDVAQRWLREVKGIHICVKPNEASTNCKYFVTVIVSDTKWGNVQDDNRKAIIFDTYEEAQEAGIKKALEIILKK